MAISDDTILTPVRIITGAIYERPRGQETEQAVCIARVTQAGVVKGLFRRFGLTFERFDESSEEMMSWKMIWSPDGSHEPKPKTKKPAKKNLRVSKAAEAK